MTENGSESLPFEPPEQENIRLREENARLRRLLAVHSIAIPQLAPENPPPAKAVEIAQPIDREERARRRIALFRSLFRGREDVYARRWPARIYARGLEGLEGYQRKPSRPPIKINEIRAANLTSYQPRRRSDNQVLIESIAYRPNRAESSDFSQGDRRKIENQLNPAEAEAGGVWLFNPGTPVARLRGSCTRRPCPEVTRDPQSTRSRMKGIRFSGRRRPTRPESTWRQS
jgi:hypothetical protein